LVSHGLWTADSTKAPTWEKLERLEVDDEDEDEDEDEGVRPLPRNLPP
jgi:hypothetical protein